MAPRQDTHTRPAGQCIDRREERAGDLAVLIPRRDGDPGSTFLTFGFIGLAVVLILKLALLAASHVPRIDDIC